MREEMVPLYKYKMFVVQDSVQKIPPGVINSEEKAAAIFRPHFLGADREYLFLLMLDNQNQFLGLTPISMGSDVETIAHPKYIYGPASECRAHGIILAHNHPSGSIKPSESDLMNFKTIAKGGRIMDIEFMDHLIFGNVESSKEFYSWKRDGGYL